MIRRAGTVIFAALALTAPWAPILWMGAVALDVPAARYLPPALALIFCLSILAITLAMSAGSKDTR